MCRISAGDPRIPPTCATDVSHICGGSSDPTDLCDTEPVPVLVPVPPRDRVPQKRLRWRTLARVVRMLGSSFVMAQPMSRVGGGRHAVSSEALGSLEPSPSGDSQDHPVVRERTGCGRPRLQATPGRHSRTYRARMTGLWGHGGSRSRSRGSTVHAPPSPTLPTRGSEVERPSRARGPAPKNPGPTQIPHNSRWKNRPPCGRVRRGGRR